MYFSIMYYKYYLLWSLLSMYLLVHNTSLTVSNGMVMVFSFAKQVYFCVPNCLNTISTTFPVILQFKERIRTINRHLANHNPEYAFLTQWLAIFALFFPRCFAVPPMNSNRADQSESSVTNEAAF